MSKTTNLNVPSVAILMATYNGEAYISEQIESLLNQTYSHWKLIVSDDGSTDHTVDVLNSYARMDSRIELVPRHERFGSAKANFMSLLQYAGTSYDYVFFCDQDDVWSSQKIELELTEMKHLESLNGKDNPTLVCTDLHVVNDRLELLDPSFMTYSNFPHQSLTFCKLLIENNVVGCTMLANKALVTLAIKTPRDSFIVMHDRWLALLSAGIGTLSYLDTPTVEYRQHHTNSLGAARFSLANMVNLDVWKTQCQQIRNSVLQAQSFQQTFQHNLHETDAKRLSHFCLLLGHPHIMRIPHAFMARAWKTGMLRNAAYLWALMFSRWI